MCGIPLAHVDIQPGLPGTGARQLDHRAAHVEPSDASPTGESLPPERILAMFRDYLLSLPADRFPHVHRAVDEILGGDADDRFMFGLEVILRGIATFAGGELPPADQPPSPAPAPPVPDA